MGVSGESPDAMPRIVARRFPLHHPQRPRASYARTGGPNRADRLPQRFLSFSASLGRPPVGVSCSLKTALCRVASWSPPCSTVMPPPEDAGVAS